MTDRVFNIVQDHIIEEDKDSTWDERHKGKLAVSDLGHCPRKAMLRIHGIELTDDFDDYTKRLMWSGRLAEHKMEAVLHSAYGDDFQSQVHVENDVFIGTVDFITEEAIIEHKETATSNFHYKRLPYDFHLLQVMAYRHLYGDPALHAILYYQNRADWAEFEVRQDCGQILYEGHINDSYRFGDLGTTVENEMQRLTYWYDKDELPPRCETPFEKNFYCTKMYKVNAYPSCTYWHYCWGNTEYADMEKIPIPEERR